MWSTESAPKDPILRLADDAEDRWRWVLYTCIFGAITAIVGVEMGIPEVRSLFGLQPVGRVAEGAWSIFIALGFLTLVFSIAAIDAYLARRRLFAALEGFVDFRNLAERHPWIPENVIRRRYEELRRNTGVRQNTQV